MVTSPAYITLSDSLKIPSGSVFKVSGTVINNSVISTKGKIDYFGTITNNGIIDLNSGSDFQFSDTTAFIPNGVFNWNVNANMIVSSGSHLLEKGAFL